MEYLPIGSVVLLKNAEQKIMITGRLQVCSEDQKVYDYCAVHWPQGVLNSSRMLLFNADALERVCFLGMQGEEEDQFCQRLNRLDHRRTAMQALS